MASTSQSTASFGPHVTHVNGQLTPTKQRLNVVATTNTNPDLARRSSNPLVEVSSTDSRRNSPSTVEHNRALKKLENESMAEVILKNPNYEMPTPVKIPIIEPPIETAENRPDLSPRTKQLMSFWHEKEREVVKPANSNDNSPIISSRVRNSIFLQTSPAANKNGYTSPGRPLPASPTKPLNFNKAKSNIDDVQQLQEPEQQTEQNYVRPLNLEKRSSLLSTSGSLRSKKVTFEMAPPQVLEFETGQEFSSTSPTSDETSLNAQDGSERRHELFPPPTHRIERPSSPLAKYNSQDGLRPQRASSIKGARPLPVLPPRQAAAEVATTATPQMSNVELRRNPSVASEYDPIDLLDAYNDSDYELEMATVKEEDETEAQERISVRNLKNDEFNLQDKETDEEEPIAAPDVLEFIASEPETEVFEKTTAEEEPVTELDDQLQGLKVSEDQNEGQKEDAKDLNQLPVSDNDERIQLEENMEDGQGLEDTDTISDIVPDNDDEQGEDILQAALADFRSSRVEEIKSEPKMMMTKSSSTGSFMDLPFESDEKESTLGFDEYLNSKSFLSRDWSQSNLLFDRPEDELDTAVLMNLPKGRASAIQTIKSSSGARTRPSMTPGDIRAMASEVRKASIESEERRFLDLPDIRDQLPGSPTRKHRFLDLDFGEEDSFDLDKEFDQVVEIQNVSKFKYPLVYHLMLMTFD